MTETNSPSPRIYWPVTKSCLEDRSIYSLIFSLNLSSLVTNSSRKDVTERD